MFITKNSCDEIILRVKRDPFFNSSIDLFKRSEQSRQSTTELTTEPHSRRASWPIRSNKIRAQQIAPEHSEASGFHGIFSASVSYWSPIQCAGRVPAFQRAQLVPVFARRAEFISVSGQCAARSAHFSDLRKHKRISGGVAATEHLHAPMNSPTRAAVQAAAQRVSFPTSARKCIEGDSSWQ